MPNRKRPVIARVLFLLTLALLTVPTAQAAPAKRVVAFYSHVESRSFAARMIPYQLLTHVIHLNLSPRPGGNFDVPADFLEPDLLDRAHAAGVRVLVSIGGPASAAG